MTTPTSTLVQSPRSAAAMAAPGPGAHVRRHASVLAGMERRALVWMARRLPPSIDSDQLSALGWLAMLGAGLSFWAARHVPDVGLPLVVACLALNWLGDSLDGTVARVRNRLRPRYGFYLDHVLDASGTAFLLGGLGLSGLMHPLTAACLYGAFLLVMAESFLATHVRGVFNMAFLGFGPTELRLVISAGVLWVWRQGMWVSPFGAGPCRLFDVGGAAAIAGLLVAFAAASVRNTVALYREETTWR